MTKRLRSKGMKETPAQRAENALELAAWNEWKDVCRILRCSETHRASLKKRMWKSSLEKLEILLEETFPEWKDEYSEEGWQDEIAECFDSFIQEGKDDTSGRRLNYKDTIWHVIAENQRRGVTDSPLKVIRGKLTAPKRVLDGVLEQLVREKGWTPKVVKHKPLSVGSLNEPVGDSGEGDGAVEKIDLLPAAKGAVAVEEDERLDIARKLRDQFSFVECALLFAHFNRLSFADPIVAEVAGVRSSRASEMYYGGTKKGRSVPGVEDKFRAVLKDMRDIARDAGWTELTRIVMRELQRKLSAENRGIRFLSKVESLKGNVT